MQNSGEWIALIDAAVERQFAEMREVRRHMHCFPEPSMGEFNTTAFLAERLSSRIADVRLGPESRGLIVNGNGAAGPRIGLRADIDALRIQDAKEVSYRSQYHGLMHACGHDGHTATVLGAVLALSEFEKESPWSICWRGIFQPAEETNQGALEMVEAGAVDGLSALLGLHMDPSRSVGTIGVREGDFTADCNELEIKVIGRGAHAARPHESIDPIAAAAQMISSVYLFIPRKTNSQEPVVISFGQIFGGENANVIPDDVTIRGTLRCLHEAVSKETIKHIEQLARGMSETSGTKIIIKHKAGPPPVKNDPLLTRLITEAGREVLGEEHVHHIERPSMGGEDFANYLYKVPGAMFRLGCSPPGVQSPPLHAPLFDLHEDALLYGAKILARSVVQFCAPDSSFRTQ